MYTIKQASQRTGIAIPTIRVWERRYGVVAPTRTPAGYRLYDDDSIARLRAMQHLVDLEGWRPSQAADRIREADVADLDDIAEPPGRSRAPALESAAARGASEAIDAIVDGARRLDIGAIERTLDDTFAGQRFESAMDLVVFPALRGIGDAWGKGELDVAREHAASEVVRRRIAHYFDAAARMTGGRTVVVGLPPGSRHELGAFAFAVAARRAGLDVLYLGADVPIDAWRRTVRDADPAAVIMAVVSRGDVGPATDVIRALRGDGPRPIAIGGPAASGLVGNLDAIRLPDPIDDAVATLLEVVGPAAS
jgi:methanogenic corrinoid protein MtbC1